MAGGEAARAKVRLLLCDAQALFRAGMAALLRDQAGIEISGEAADGRAALVEADRLRPDVVLMDVALPGLDGAAATRRLARSHPDVKVLILSMYSEDEVVARCLEAGARGYVLKDEPAPQLAYAIGVVARGGRYLSPAVLQRRMDPRGLPLEPTRTRYDLLTGREREVLKLLAEGLSTKEVAAGIDCSVKTAEVHKYNLMRKLDVHHRAGLVRYAIVHRLVDLPVFSEGPRPPGPGTTPARD
jgi:DNA-binding NarL/FixJ family response regulator